ncbi:MAG TPA: UDP-N-acetylmuramoyl-L-alanine--D-glutamate ligase [Thermoanaerobaculia bacterium]|nr:UDP-N-acetylmuramoyl-L-alanine--D-glutamate ligase [Thermoanaerobaculia bacterium]
MAILGLARSGTALAAALAARGIAVAAGDRRARREIDPTGALETAGVVLFSDGADSSMLDGADLLAISPGVPLSHPVAAEARRRGIPVVSELEVAWRLIEEEAEGENRWIAVTGTNGKSTVSTWIAEILRRDGRDVALAGNIGTALSTFCSSRRPRHFVVEVSSFQLETIERFRADVAVVTNITPDHLDRHASLAAYAAAKARIFENQREGDAAVVNDDDRGSAGLHPPARRVGFSTLRSVDGGVWAENGYLWSGIDEARRRICGVSEVALPGLHNLENALASAAAAELAGASAESIRAGLTRFAGLPHRTELVAVAEGVAWVDDSKGTNPDAVVKSLAGYPDGRVVLILGGSEKGSDFSILAAPVARKARVVLTIGQSAEKIERSISGVETKRAGDMERAVDLAASAARPGDTVLLSPACASFDQYRNYEERGDHFRSLVLGRVAHGA